MMPFLLAEFPNPDITMPLYVSCVGSHAQKKLDRPRGYNAHQLFLSRRGSGVFRIAGGTELTLTPGTILLLPAKVGHTYTPDDSGEIWDLGFVAFHGEAVEALLEAMNRIVLKVLPAPNFEHLWKQLESLWHLINLNGEAGYWEASKHMYDILLSVLEGQTPAKKSPKALYSSAHPNKAIRNAVKLMHEHYNERLLLANVARAAGYSIQHFHRLFVADYGVTPQQYILQLRMGHALQLLEGNPGISVEKIAEKVGMDTSYFIRMFKRTYGVTPKKYASRL